MTYRFQLCAGKQCKINARWIVQRHCNAARCVRTASARLSSLGAVAKKLAHYIIIVYKWFVTSDDQGGEPKLTCLDLALNGGFTRITIVCSARR